MITEVLLAVILLWDGYFFLRYLLSLGGRCPTSSWAPKVSILIPAYNEEKNIKRAIDAALSQDYPSLEVIVVDDGSTDDTYNAASSIKDPHLKVLRIPHSGKARALNAGLEVASGEVIITTDADGWLERNAVGRLVERFYRGDVVAVGGQVRVFPGGFLELVQDIEHIRIATFRRAYELENLSLAPGPVSAFRGDALEKIGGFANDLVEDYATTIAVKKLGKVVYAPKARAWVRMPTFLGRLWRQRKRWFLGDLPKLGGGPLKEKAFLVVSDVVAFADVVFPILAIAFGKWVLLLVFLAFEFITMAAAVWREGGLVREVLLFPIVLWFWAAFYLSLHAYGYLRFALSKGEPAEWK
ncbi:glycosyltransferase family 2 protein [Thermococcus sp. Bubb.Bath]|uniref:glycosyltransferase n=1 Tax=Thermococcus sp. Bubb.Bath TaxID=1638242 RepID=UPI001438C3E1|nr:glycosyltransferase family 2 protein [Thermococcus sp. Bubb.Bath]NJF24377.1 glycosyltransferase family 2 protein [Thermococcus sp. Bubb.Bath]